MSRMSGAPRVPSEPGLLIRMVVAMALCTTLVAGGAAACVWLLVFVPGGWLLVVMLGCFALEGIRVSRHRAAARGSRRPTAADDERVGSALERLSLVAGVRRPQQRVLTSRVPLSWTTALPWGPATVHVSTGMLDRLADRELHAVMAHELAHLLHRDAIVMTVLAGPPSYLLAGVRETVHEHRWNFLGILIWGLALGVPSALMLALSRVVSRHRELVADRAAAVLTGSPSAVAAALVAVDQGLQRVLDHDLRMAAPRDSLHFAPARPPRRIGRLWATHPSLQARLEHLDGLEAGLRLRR